ncbi:hypothetical protein AQUCO_00400080v1 [Aquilegia coerulea]|uniref:Protein HIRA n=1 Tax=Aquilegia coerulea TaxID=218851 RepID=A0A2G5ETB8_AQUCA|nr:hypothetical protein AQUCO_00400080v1 [Aquilegia coerulea]
MIAEKPDWIKHEGSQIFSIDIQPGGLRFATGGGDHKVRIWNMLCVGKESEGDQSAERVLATLSDHFGSVNCVRWAKHGRYLASGSDDQMIHIHERKPGTGTSEFGSGEPADVENWKVAMTFRGHTADVVDINFAPDDTLLASGSLDNTVHIWNLSNGTCTTVLRGHSSLVKGVAWDPIGSFIATQSDDKTVIIWRTKDWSLCHRTDGHWAKSLGSTFFRRLGWSPCGHFITTTHGFQKPRHSAPVLERGEWAATFDFLGHNAPIIVVKFNHSMFRRSISNGQDAKALPVGWSNGTSKIAAKDTQPYNVIAIGSQDRTITVWTTASPRPLFVAKHFFSQSVVDLSWSPDGYALFACSLDGTVATFHFEVKELGHRLSDAELDELRRHRYGEGRGKVTKMAESPAQLLLETASLKESANKKLSPSLQNQTTGKKSVDLGVTSVDQPLKKVSNSQIENGKKKGSNGSDRSNKMANSTQKSSPVKLKQKEYTGADGRKRIIAVGLPAQPERTSAGVEALAVGFPRIASNNQKDVNVEGGLPVGSVKINGSSEEYNLAGGSGHGGVKEQSGYTARATISEKLVIEKVPIATSTDVRASVDRSEIVKASDSKPFSSSTLSITVYNTKEGKDSIPVCLEAHAVEQAVNDVVGIGNVLTSKETEVTCTHGDQTLWSDKLSGKVTVLAGNANFWAVGCADGCLQVYTKCGRRAMPTMMMGSAAIFIDCDECWKLLLITRKGSIYVWDLFNNTCLLHDSLDSLITSGHELPAKDSGTMQVISARFSKSGSPLVILATRHAFLFDMSLKCWMRIADDCFPASSFASSWSSGSIRSGELAALQVDIGKYLARKPSWSRVTNDGVQTRAHLESQLASSLALQSPNEYRQCLLSYIRFLAREADESRLREVCESFLGPPVGMVEATCSDPTKMTWDPCVLGIDKHKLLREDILPAMASNRKVQRLLNEFINLLSEYGTNESSNIQVHPTPTAIPQVVPITPAKDQVPSQPVAEQVDPALPTKEINS